MNKSFVIALALILALIKGSNGYQRDEAKCLSRRCCSMRDELTEYDLPEGLDCRKLTDRKCGEYNSYCEWDCDEVNPIRKNKNIMRKYRGISSGAGVLPKKAMTGIPAQNKDEKEYTNKELLQRCLSQEGKFISHDDCGVEYEEEIKDWDAICHRLYDNDDDHHNDNECNADNNDQHGYDKKRRLNEDGVLGPDGRTWVNDMNIYPNNAVLFMQYDHPNGESFRCTATMISPNVAITAAHCVWSPQGYHSNFEMFYNMDDCNEGNLQANAGNYFTAQTNTVSIPSAYQNNFVVGSNNAANDIALIRLNTNGKQPNYMAFGYNNNFQAGTQFTSIGYPGDKECYPYQQTCAYSQFTVDQMISTECDHVGGQSGSAKYQWTNNRPVVYGVISSGVPGVKNTDCRIDATKYQWICQYTQTCNDGSI